MSKCQCGCGQPAPLAPHSRASKGMVKDLEPVTQAENIRRGVWAERSSEVRMARPTCKNGHAWTDDTLRDGDGYRVCRECRRTYKARYRAARMAVSA